MHRKQLQTAQCFSSWFILTDEGDQNEIKLEKGYVF